MAPQLYDCLCDYLEPQVTTCIPHLGPTSTGVVAEVIASSWSEVLRNVYREQGRVELSDSLLPYNLGSGKKAWDSNLRLFGVTEEQVREILSRLGEEKKAKGIVLPWGGCVRLSNGRYFLEGED